MADISTKRFGIPPAGHQPEEGQAMNTTAAFLRAIDGKTRGALLESIARHYGITPAEALAEVTDPDAEHLLDYLTGPARNAASVLMQRHGFAHATP